jgi:hypothetical protein
MNTGDSTITKTRVCTSLHHVYTIPSNGWGEKGKKTRNRARNDVVNICWWGEKNEERKKRVKKEGGKEGQKDVSILILGRWIAVWACRVGLGHARVSVHECLVRAAARMWIWGGVLVLVLG